MRITITCPHCQQQSQIETQHRGRRLRCPYDTCRQPFIVGEDGLARALDEGKKPVASSAPAPPSEPGPTEVDWQQSAAAPDLGATAAWEPPPVRRDSPGTREEYVPEVTAVEEEGAPPPPSWEPPPVRRPGFEEPSPPPEEVVVTAAVEEGESTSTTDYSLYAPTRKKRTGLVIIIGAAILFVISAGLVVFFLRQMQAGEGRNFEIAMKFYRDGRYRQAADGFRQLAETYSSSDKKPLYTFMEELSRLRDATSGTIADVAQTNALAAAFVKDQKSQAAYKEHQEEIWESLANLAAAAAERAKAEPVPELLEIAKECVERAKSEGATIRDGAKVEQRHADLDNRLAQAAAAVAMAQARGRLLDAISGVMARKVPGSAEQVLRLYDEEVKQHPKLKEDNDLQQRLTALQREEPEWVAFSAETPPRLLPRGPAPSGKASVSVLVGPKLQGDAAASPEAPVVLALDRGVLYGLSQADGQVRWAMRVGIDTTLLPARLRAGPAQPELALVLSAVDNTVSAVETTTGRTQWHYQLDSPCSAGPILVGRPPIAYLPTQNGKVYVVEPLMGRLLGVYETGQPLTVPGSYDPITQRLFLPAAHRRILVLDVQNKRCAGVIYTGHAVGGLRGAPVIAPPSPGQPSVILIAEADNLGSMKLRAFTVPDAVSDAKPALGADGKPIEFTVPGWSWFSPYFDGDTLGIATDRGYLALFGLKRGTNDRPVYRLSFQPLPIGDPNSPLFTGQRPIGRAQIAQVTLGKWWLLVGGNLQPFRFDLYRQQLVRAGSESLPLGSPVQEAQVLSNGQQMVLVTQALDGTEGLDRTLATCLATSTGKVLWQRQLGFICNQEPLVLGNRLFAVDKLGGLLSLDSERGNVSPDQAWLTDPQWLSNGVEESAVARLLVSPDGKQIVTMTFLARSERVRIQRHDIEQGKTTEHFYRLDSPPVGTPVLTETSVMAPCRDGTLREFPLGGARELPVPLTWRDPKAGLAVGHAALVAPDHLLIANGLNRLQQWKKSGNVWQKGEDVLELPTGRIITPLLVIPRESDRYLCLGDDANHLHLFSASRLVPLRVWDVGGRITRGPFLRGRYVGCIVDNVRLVWLDPEQDTLLWQYPAPGEGPGKGWMVGEPALHGEQVIVAHRSGDYVWLDAATGKVQATSHVGSQAIPTTGVVPFGPGRVLSPLSDGTLMIVTPSGG
ncbi:MAG: PQQ-binding-like beta-propeller repeat protein [Gemmatales bacterium]|nr:PQQ-binding-like beta-propeller repeat protein [Gemmatales bacterium]MDW8386878.1 PQQ-binding-like beta-propeller repeat protein [Gemmatales bacterium]